MQQTGKVVRRFTDGFKRQQLSPGKPARGFFDLPAAMLAPRILRALLRRH
jgi:hypothetical protein